MTEVNGNERKPARLVILLPEGMENLAGFARLANQMAAREGRSVLFLGVVEDPLRRLSMVRWLATLEAATRGAGVPARSQVAVAGAWMGALQQACQPGDRVVCLDEQTARKGLWKNLPLRQFIAEDLGLPVQAVAGFYRPRQAAARQWGQGLLFWLGWWPSWRCSRRWSCGPTALLRRPAPWRKPTPRGTPWW